MFQKIKPFRSAKYLSWIRKQPCSYTGKTENITAHHPISCNLGGVMGGKVSDLFCIPLDAEFHTLGHASKDGFEAYIDQKKLALETIEKAVNAGVLSVC